MSGRFQQFHLCIWSGTESALCHAVLHDRMAVSYDPSISWSVYKLSFLFYLLKSHVRIGDVDGCYGRQTGSGKTHTMWGQMPGSNSADYVPTEDRGITPRIFEQLFSRIQQVDQLILQKETVQNDVLYMSQNNFVAHQNALMIVKFQHFKNVYHVFS